MSRPDTLAPELHAQLTGILQRLQDSASHQAAMAELDALRARHPDNHVIGLAWCSTAIDLTGYTQAIDYARHMLPRAATPLLRAHWQQYLGMAHMFRGDLSEALPHYADAIEALSDLGERGEFPVSTSSQELLPRLDEQGMAAIEDRLWQVLAALKRHGLHGFPMYGTLLGFERGGTLLAFDKDVDLGVWLEDLHAASAVMKEMGMTVSPNTPPFDNYVCFVDPQSTATFDLLAMRREPENQRMITGFWLYNKPADHQKIGYLPWFGLVDKPGPHGPAWWPDNADAILTAIYGQWRIPQPEFDTALSACNAQSRGLLQHRCFAYARLINRWFSGDMPRTQRYLVQALRHLPEDQVLLRAKAMFDKGSAHAIRT